MNRKILIVVLALILIGIAVVSMKILIGMKEVPHKDVNRKVIPYVKVTPVKYGTLLSPVEEKGRLLANLEVTISSEVSGRILETGISLKVGQHFREGDLLVKIYDTDYRMELKSRKSDFLNRLAGTLPDIKVDYPKRFDEWMRFFNSISLEKPLPQLPGIESAQEKIFLASRNILGEYYGIKSAEVKLEKYNIYAPFEGSYVQVYTQVGSVASPGVRLADVIESRNLELQVPVESRDIRWLKLGDKVDILTDEGEVVCTGTLVRKAGFVDPATQSIDVFIHLNLSESYEMYQGQYYTARFSGKELSGVMEIPRNAVFRSNRVFVVNDGKLRTREIQVVKINDNTLVFNGLNEGELLVIEPLVRATENMSVRILEE